MNAWPRQFHIALCDKHKSSDVNPSDDIGIRAGFMAEGMWNPGPV